MNEMIVNIENDENNRKMAVYIKCLMLSFLNLKITIYAEAQIQGETCGIERQMFDNQIKRHEKLEMLLNDFNLYPLRQMHAIPRYNNLCVDVGISLLRLLKFIQKIYKKLIDKSQKTTCSSYRLQIIYASLDGKLVKTRKVLQSVEQESTLHLNYSLKHQAQIKASIINQSRTTINIDKVQQQNFQFTFISYIANISLKKLISEFKLILGTEKDVRINKENVLILTN
ncbi:unnamed protein product [Paramecium sonneborni]|uniref:Uncharacterized protein n=1 Tax=Paramecium sonneborni TaxID=65129 RepID=A0A8S1RDG7_9CILI|nr:unnamed protein product [Paramecium sonneborni]